MNRFYTTAIMLLAAGILVAGMVVTAHALRDLGGKPVALVDINNEPGYTRITLLGTDYEVHLPNYIGIPFPADFPSEQVLMWCRELALVRALDLHLP